MVIDGNFQSKSKLFDSQLCIIGGGVAGIVLANELKDSFESILLVESGNEIYDQLVQDLYKAESFPDHYPDPLYSRLRFLGGSSNHWQNNTSPLSPIDFEYRDWIPNSGWPIEYESIAKHYSKAQRYCGVGDDGYDTHYWSNKLNQIDLVKQSTVLESNIAKFALSPTNFYKSFGPTLLKSNNITILSNTNLVDLIFNSESKTVTALNLKSNSGNDFIIRSEKFVFAMGGIENARMMLAFNDKYENKIGNQNDCVGRYFMEHPTPRAAHLFVSDMNKFNFYQEKIILNKRIIAHLSLSESALRHNQTTNFRIPLVKQDHYSLSDGISSSHILFDKAANLSLPNNLSSHLYNVISNIDMLVEAIARKNFDIDVFDHAKKIAGFSLPMMMEQTPAPENRITMGLQKDKYNIPLVNVNYKVSDDDKNLLWSSLLVAGKEIGALSLGRLKLLQERALRLWGDQLGFSNHHMGTTRMSNSPETGVVNNNLKVFDTTNLYIVGSSVFPTGGCVPPTLTIVALSIRLAEHLKNV